MKNRTTSKRTADKRSVGQEIITGLKQAVAWAGGENVPVRVTTVRVPTTDVRALRRRLGMSQSEFAARFGFQAATLKNWEQGRTRPDGRSGAFPGISKWTFTSSRSKATGNS